MSMVVPANPSNVAFSSSPAQWQLLSDRIEKNIEDVLNEVVPPRAQTAPPRAGDLAIEDLMEAGRDLRLDQAYPEFYKAQHGGNAMLPSPLDTTTLFNSLAKKLLEGQDVRQVQNGDIANGPGVRKLFNLVQELQEARSQAQTPALAQNRDRSLSGNLAAGLSQLQVGSRPGSSLSQSAPNVPRAVSRSPQPQPQPSPLAPQQPVDSYSPPAPAPAPGRGAPAPMYQQEPAYQPPPFNTAVNYEARPRMRDMAPVDMSPVMHGPGMTAAPAYMQHYPPQPPAGIPASHMGMPNSYQAFYAACMASGSGPPVAMVDQRGNVVPMPDAMVYPQPHHARGYADARPNAGGYGVPVQQPYSRGAAHGMRGCHLSPDGRAGTGYARRRDMPSGSPPYDRRLHPKGRVRTSSGGYRDGDGDMPHSELSLDELRGKIVGMAKEQHGCRYLQRLIAGESAERAQIVVDEILPETGALMTDPFGNYLVQKVLENCSVQQRLALLDAACAAGLSNISRDTHGTRSVQKLVEAITTPTEAARFVRELEPDCLQLILDANGNHVVQRCLQKFSSQHTAAIQELVRLHCVDVARHRHGCCVLQRCMDFASAETKRQLVLAVSAHGLDLSQNAFGNYVIQYILDTGVMDACTTILEQLRGRFAELSCQKFSSNVVEKALKLSTVGMEGWRDVIVDELVATGVHADVLKDQFGNYVLQSALRSTSGETHAKLVAAIKPHMASLKTMQHGKRILQQVQGAV